MKRLLLCGFIFSLVQSIPIDGGMPQRPPMQVPDQRSYKDMLMSLPEMSEAEVIKMQKEIDEQINQYVKTLSPGEQQQFYKEVDELSQIMSQMSEEELMQFMDKALSDAPVQQFTKPTPTETGPAAEIMPILQPIPEEAPKQVEVRQPEKGAQSLINTLESIIASIERFLLKAQIIPELPGDIENWVEKGKVHEWNPGLTWATLKEKTEALLHRLKRMKERDPQRQAYRYLGYINEPLQNNLRRLQSVLNDHEPHVEAPAFGLGKVSKNSRAAIRDVLSALAEAVYSLHLIDELDKVLKEYEPREKELSQAEETSRKRALEESKKHPSFLPAHEIGYGTSEGFVVTEVGTEREPSYYPDMGAGMPFYEPRTPSHEREAAGKGTPSGKGTSATPSTPAKKGAGKEEKKEGEGKGEKKPAEDKRADTYLSTIERHLDKVIQTFDDMPKLAFLEKHVMSAEPADPSIVQALRTITNSYKRANDSVKALKLHLANKKQSIGYYNNELSSIMKVHKSATESLMKQVASLVNKASSIPATHKKAYMSGEGAEATTPQVAGASAAPAVQDSVSLRDLLTAQQELQKSITAFKS